MEDYTSVDVYVTADCSKNGVCRVPLYTAVTLFVYKFCRLDARHRLHFVPLSVISCHDSEENCLLELDDTSFVRQIDWLSESEIPLFVSSCQHPVAICHNERLVVSGLCSVLRLIVRAGQEFKESLKDAAVNKDEMDALTSIGNLLGQRQNCLRACSEVSAWTKYCEVSLPQAVIRSLNITPVNGKLSLPELTHLENYIAQPLSTSGCKGNTKHLKSNRTKLAKAVDTDKQKSSGCGETVLNDVTDQSKISLSELYDLIENRFTIADDGRKIDLTRVFVEGNVLQLTDLIVFVCVNTMFSILECKAWIPDLHRVVAWYRRVSSLSCIQQTAKYVRFSPSRMHPNEGGDFSNGSVSVNCDPLLATQTDTDIPSDAVLTEAADPSVSSDELHFESLSSNKTATETWANSKFKVTQAAIDRATEKLTDSGIRPRSPIQLDSVDVRLQWDQFPKYVLPTTSEGGVPDSRANRKLQQLENMAAAVLKLVASRGQSTNGIQTSSVIVDFCSGGGHLGILLAHLLPHCKIILVENKEESLRRALDRIAPLDSSNITVVQCNLSCFRLKFDIGVCLHACGVATDLVLEKCLESHASFAVCPCCYGSIHNTHSMTYPRSQIFQNARLSYQDYLSIGHAADQTQTSIAKAEQGRTCMAYVDLDRCSAMEEKGYNVTLHVMNPVECSTKNHILVGLLNA